MVTVSTSFLVLAVELDSGTLFLAGRGGSLGRDELTPAVLSFGSADKDGASLTVEAQALPDYVHPSRNELRSYWTNRAAMLLECDAGMGSVYDGRPMFDGVIAAEPPEQDGVLSLNLIPYRAKIVQLPGYGVVDAATYPTAPADSQGAHKPLIFGTVDDCPLIPVALPESTTLSVAASAPDAQLEVADATRFAASGSVVVDGHTYTYSAKSGNILLGVAVAGDHRAGTMVAQSGSAVYLAAGHALTALDTLRASGVLLQGATVDLAAATATFASLPAVAVAGSRSNIALQFDALGTGNTALNGSNAIRYATVQAAANATALPANVTASTDPLTSVILFARPAERIVRGIYTVAFTVSIGAQIGWARVRIGGDVVWQMEAPASVIYNYSPATVLLDDDTDVLPLVVEVEDGGSADQVSVTVTSASRVVYTGNLDDANYATLRQPSNNLFRADQLTANPDLGIVKKAQLVVRWFAGKSGMGVPTVKFGGRTLGVLAQTQLADAALAQNIAVDVVSQGVATLPQQSISTVVSGGTASLSHATLAQQQIVYCVLAPFADGTTFRGFSKVPTLTGWDVSLGNITAKITVRTTTGAAPNNLFMWANIRRANGTTIHQVNINTVGAWSNVATNMYEASLTIAELPDSVYWEETFKSSTTDAMVSMAFSYNARITNGAVSQINTPASGYSNPITAQNLGHSGTAVGVTGGNINFTVPAPPRVVDTVFDLAGYTEWAQFTGKQVEIGYAGGAGVDLCVVQAYLSIEYDAVTYAAVGGAGAPLTATVGGLAGNPAEVLAWLVQASGATQRVDGAARARLAAWCAANSYSVARRIAEPTDALQLLTFAAEQASAVLCDTPDGMRMLRWFDLAETATVIDPLDLLGPAAIGWAERAENEITLNYRAAYSGNASAALPGGSPGGFGRTLVADAGNNPYCRKSLAALAGEVRAITLDGGWIRDDLSAARYLTDTARRHAIPHRLLTLQLPFSYAGLTVGALIEYDGIEARITALADDNGWLDLTAGFAKPAGLYYALLTTAVADDGTGGVECSGGAYARVNLPPLDVNYAAPAAGNGVTSNAVAVTFPSPTANWGAVSDMAIYDSNVGGNLVAHATFPSVRNVNNGDLAPSIGAGAYTLTVA